MKNISHKQPIDVFLKITILSIVLVWSFLIVKPFVTIIVWSVLVGIALYPVYEKVIKAFKGKKKSLVTTLFILILLAIIVVPTIQLSTSIVTSSVEFKESFEAGTIKIPPPSNEVKEWPIIGEKVFDLWTQANANLQNLITEHREALGKIFGSLFSSFTGLMGSVFLALFSLIFAGVFMYSAESGYKSSVLLGNRLIEGKGEGLVQMIISTIRSVVKGILLVAIIQAVLAYIGFAVIGLPAAGFFALIVLVFAIVQIPALLAMIPAIGIVFSIADTTPAIIFTVYAIIVSLSDNVLKPMLLGKGLETPMLVILIGALGGMMSMGMLGLFIGPVVLSVVYQLYIKWVEEAREIE